MTRVYIMKKVHHIILWGNLIWLKTYKLITVQYLSVISDSFPEFYPVIIP